MTQPLARAAPRRSRPGILARRIRPWLEVLTLVLGGLAAAVVVAAEVGNEPALLFEIRAAASDRSSFLLGTIHSEDPRVIELPEPVRDALERSSGFAMEVVPDAAGVIKAMMVMTYTDGRVLRDVLPADTYVEVCEAMESLGMSEEAFKDFKPWAVMIQLSTPLSESGEFLDMLLYRIARSQDKEVVGLETMEEQLAIFDALDEADQVVLLRDVLASRADLPAMLDQLTSAYLERDLQALQRIHDAELAEVDPRIAALFRSRVVSSRNQRMLERMRPLLDRGGWFVAVGALHLAGDSGLVRLLRGAGYSVTPLY